MKVLSSLQNGSYFNQPFLKIYVVFYTKIDLYDVKTILYIRYSLNCYSTNNHKSLTLL